MLPPEELIVYMRGRDTRIGSVDALVGSDNSHFVAPISSCQRALPEYKALLLLDKREDFVANIDHLRTIPLPLSS